MRNEPQRTQSTQRRKKEDICYGYLRRGKQALVGVGWIILI